MAAADNNPATVDIVASGGNLYQRHHTGLIWQYTGTPLTGWQQLDNNPATVDIVASGGNLYQRHNTGLIWQYTGTPLTGWLQLDNNPATVQIVADGGNLYQRHNTGLIWQYTGTPDRMAAAGQQPGPVLPCPPPSSLSPVVAIATTVDTFGRLTPEDARGAVAGGTDAQATCLTQSMCCASCTRRCPARSRPTRRQGSCRPAGAVI